MTVRDILSLVVSEYELERRRSLASAKASMGHVAHHLGKLPIGRLVYEDLQEYVLKRRAEGAAEATIRIELVMAKHGLRIAEKQGLIARGSIPEFPRIDKRGLKVRSGVISAAEVERICRFLTPDLGDLIRFLFVSAWRVGEAQKMLWSWVGQDAIRMPASETKTNEARILARAGEIEELVQRRRAREIGPYVFHRRGLPVKNFRHQWVMACRGAEVLDEDGKPRLVHDLRRSAITAMMAAGANQKDVMSLSGHRTASVFQRYQMVSLERQREILEARAKGKKEPARATKIVRLSDWGT